MRFIALSQLLIKGRADNHPVAMRQGRVICFAEFRRDVARVAARFAACKQAVLICEDSYYFAVGLLGLLHAGGRVVLPPNGMPHTLCMLGLDAEILVNDAVIENMDGDAAVLVTIDAQALNLVFYTSGSTGVPKRIDKSVAMFEAESAVFYDMFGGALQGLVMATVPHHHVYGLSFKIMLPLMAGFSFASAYYILWEDLLADIVSNAFIISSPAHLARLGGVDALALSLQPRHIVSAGAPLSFDAVQKAAGIFGCYPTEIFGSTETGAFATRKQTQPNTPWHLLYGIEARQDAEGRLALKSPFIGAEWLATEDLVERVGDGFHFLGRADRVVKIEGKRVHLGEIENALNGLALVKEAAVILLSGEKDGIVAALVLNEQGEARLADMGAFRFGRFLRKELSVILDAAAIPRVWRFVGELPSHSMGKRRDGDIRALFGGER